MDWLRIDNTDVGYLCLGLLAVSTAAYLLSVPGKSRGTWWLAGVATALALSVAAALVPSVLDLARVHRAGPFLLGLDALFLALSATAAVGFAYEVFADAPGPGARWGGGLTLAATAALTLALAATAVGVPVRPRPVVIGAHAVAGLAYLWAAGVLAWKARAASAEGPSRTRRALRAYAALFLVGVLAAAAGYAVRFSGTPEYVVWGALLAFLLGLITLYVNYAPEPSTLQAKVGAFVLAAALAALSGAVALGNRPDDLARSSGVTPMRHEAVRFQPARGGGYLTEAVDPVTEELGAPVGGGDVWAGTRVDLGFAFPFGGRTWASARVFPTGYVSFGDGGGLEDGAPTLAPLYVPPSVEEWDVGRVFVQREPGRAVVTWLAVVSGVAGEHATFQLVLDETGAVTFVYGDAGFVRSRVRAVLPLGASADVLRVPAAGTLPPAVPPGGVLQTVPPAYDAHTSRRLLPWVWLALGVTLSVLVGLPILLRTSVTRPLHRLLDGVRRVEGGDLTTEVAVEAPDEVGRLTSHFNRMTSALRQANDDLRAYAETLEERVEARTAELAASNADLAAEKAALAQALDDLRRAQAQLIQQEKLVALGRLTSGIAHEIKNPLNFVVNFADLSRDLAGDLVRDAEGDPDARLGSVRDDLAALQANAERVAEHGRRADGIVRAMMDHARGGAEAVRPVDLNALVEEHVGLAVDAREDLPPSVVVVRDLGEDVGTVEATPRALGQVVVNLVANALDAVVARADASPDFDRPQRVTVRTRRGEDTVEVVVEDEGIGIGATALGKVFEPFYTTKPTGGGNVGLGLSLARDVVVGHGGALTVESEAGRGSTFVVVLPAA